MPLYLLIETFTNGFYYFSLNIISLSSVICSILVILSKNPIVSVLYLIGLFLSVASYLMALGINFIALSYLLVYVGAISILFIFILMLINIRISELITDNRNSIFLAIMIGIIFSLTLYITLPSDFSRYIYINSLDTYGYKKLNVINNSLKPLSNDLLLVTSKT